MIVDLVTPWCSALEARASPRAQLHFRIRHADLLERLLQLRTPHHNTFPLDEDLARLHRLAEHASDPVWQQTLRDHVACAQELGVDACDTITVIASDSGDTPCEPLVDPGPSVALLMDQVHDARSTISLAMALSALTRWRALDGTLAGPAHSRLQRAGNNPLRDAIYLEGLGVHLAAAMAPALEPHQLLGIARSAYMRLRERERALRDLLAHDLDQQGTGLVLRWLAPHAPITARRAGNTVIPVMAGRYLGWRMTRDRVARMGVADALKS